MNATPSWTYLISHDQGPLKRFASFALAESSKANEAAHLAGCKTIAKRGAGDTGRRRRIPVPHVSGKMPREPVNCLIRSPF